MIYGRNYSTQNIIKDTFLGIIVEERYWKSIEVKVLYASELQTLKTLL